MNIGNMTYFSQVHSLRYAFLPLQKPKWISEHEVTVEREDHFHDADRGCGVGGWIEGGWERGKIRINTDFSDFCLRGVIMSFVKSYIRSKTVSGGTNTAERGGMKENEGNTSTIE